MLSNNDRLISRKETAWKCRIPQPLPIIKIGSRAKYCLSDLMTYIEQWTENKVLKAKGGHA